MNLSDKLLEEMGLKYEDLNLTERETYNQQVFNVKNITIADLKEHINDMKNSVAMQLSDLTNVDEQYDKDIFLKARLKNYILLEAFLTSPDKAEKALKDSLANIKPLKGK